MRILSFSEFNALYEAENYNDSDVSMYEADDQEQEEGKFKKHLRNNWKKYAIGAGSAAALAGGAYGVKKGLFGEKGKELYTKGTGVGKGVYGKATSVFKKKDKSGINVTGGINPDASQAESENYDYWDGLEVLEGLFVAMYEKGGLNESEIVEFLDYVLYETGWELNEESYDNYFEWLLDYTEMLDEDYNGNIILSDDGIELLSEGKTIGVETADVRTGNTQNTNPGTSKTNTSAGFFKGITDKASDYANKTKKAASNFGSQAKGFYDKQGKLGKAGLIGGAAVGAAGLGYGAYRAAKALKKRREQKRLASQGMQQQPA